MSFIIRCMHQPATWVNHGSFTSIEVMRSVFGDEFEKKNSATVNAQFLTHLYLVNLTKDILDGNVLNDNELLIHEK